MHEFQTFVLLMFAAAILVGISQKIHIPYPIILVLGGAAIGFYPWEHAIHFDPNLILLIVLPPILYYASFGISYREFKHNIKEILSLALGLVIATTFLIGLFFKWIFPDFSWSLAFAFGAIIAPPDAIAATTIIKRFAINTRLLTILEGESLINDASALVLYRIAVVALLSGYFSPSWGALRFVTTVIGGIAVGVVTGYLMQRFSRRFLEPIVGVLFSFTIPYITYILADYLNVSGVLAVVINGLMGAQILLRHHSSLRRILGFAAWDIFIILMNCFVFILIGLQLPAVTSQMTMNEMWRYTGYAFLITITMVVIRMIWVYGKGCKSYIEALRHPNSAFICPEILRETAIVGWSGMRGIVSLTAVLALPYALPDGTLLAGRNEVVFITFMVILMTLVIPGLSLPFLIRWLNVKEQTDHPNTFEVRKQLTQTAQETIKNLHRMKKIDDHERDFLLDHFNLQLRRLEITKEERPKLQNLESIKSLIINEQRRKLFEIWERLEIDDKLLSQLEHELDLEETHIARAELK
jgi:monovalent cation/hydrogen antiporter